MLEHDTTRAVGRLAQAVLSLLPVAEAVAPAVRVAHPEWDGTSAQQPSGAPGWVDGAELLRRAAVRARTPPVVVCPAAVRVELGMFERAVSARLEQAALCDPACAVPAAGLDEADAIVHAAADAHRRRWARAEVRSFDGATLRAYSAGRPDRRVVVLAAVCGMPAALWEEWVRELAREHHVLTWETRGMFGAGPGEFDEMGWDVEAQARDLFAVMDHFRVESAHVMGLCGAAAVALCAAALRPARVQSLGLWHGDYELGDGTPRTPHQRDLKALMTMAAEGRDCAAGIHRVLSRGTPPAAAPELAHLVLYPYATAELLFRYCTLNGRIMDTDLRPWLPRVGQRVLVATSTGDQTAHPDASRAVAEGLPRATLRALQHGGHLSAFQANSGHAEMAARFIAGEAP